MAEKLSDVELGPCPAEMEVRQEDREAAEAEQFGKEFRAEQVRNYGCAGEVECCFPMDGNCACFNAILARHRHAALADGVAAAAAACQTWAAGFINQGGDKARFLRLCAHDLRRNQAEIVAAHIRKGKDND